MRSMETAPKDGTRILIRTRVYHWKAHNRVPVGDQWVEGRWAKSLSGTETWIAWCGKEDTHSTDSLVPIGWAPRPADEMESGDV